MIKRLNTIVFDSEPPENTNVLWIKHKINSSVFTPYVYGDNGWIELYYSEDLGGLIERLDIAENKLGIAENHIVELNNEIAVINGVLIYLDNNKANKDHTHSASDITTGTFDVNRIPVLSISKLPTGTTTSTVALGKHTHTTADITDYSPSAGVPTYSNGNKSLEIMESGNYESLNIKSKDNTTTIRVRNGSIYINEELYAVQGLNTSDSSSGVTTNFLKSCKTGNTIIKADGSKSIYYNDHEGKNLIKTGSTTTEIFAPPSERENPDSEPTRFIQAKANQVKIYGPSMGDFWGEDEREGCVINMQPTKFQIKHHESDLLSYTYYDGDNNGGRVLLKNPDNSYTIIESDNRGGEGVTQFKHANGITILTQNFNSMGSLQLKNAYTEKAVLVSNPNNQDFHLNIGFDWGWDEDVIRYDGNEQRITYAGYNGQPIICSEETRFSLYGPNGSDLILSNEYSDINDNCDVGIKCGRADLIDFHSSLVPSEIGLPSYYRQGNAYYYNAIGEDFLLNEISYSNRYGDGKWYKDMNVTIKGVDRNDMILASRRHTIDYSIRNDYGFYADINGNCIIEFSESDENGWFDEQLRYNGVGGQDFIIFDNHSIEIKDCYGEDNLITCNDNEVNYYGSYGYDLLHSDTNNTILSHQYNTILKALYGKVYYNGANDSKFIYNNENNAQIEHSDEIQIKIGDDASGYQTLIFDSTNIQKLNALLSKSLSAIQAL